MALLMTLPSVAAAARHVGLPAQPARLASCRPMARPFAPGDCSPASYVRHRAAHCRLSPLDIAWGTTADASAQDLAASLFGFSIFPYAGFLYCLTRSKKTPPVALFGFYFLLAFVGGTIPAGIYAKTHYGTTLANVDWLHGPAESLLTITNLLIVIGFRRGILDAEQKQAANAEDASVQTSEQPGSSDIST